jgi:hypothetical protein
MKFENVDLDKTEEDSLHIRIQQLEKENSRLRKVLQDNDLLDEAHTTAPVTAEEEICIKGIDQILQLIRNSTFDKNDIQNFDILHKNLRMIRGQTVDTKKQKPTDVGELLKLVKNE